MWHQILNFFFPNISVVPMAFQYNFFLIDPFFLTGCTCISIVFQQCNFFPLRMVYLEPQSTIQVFRLSHVVLAIIGKSTFWYLQKLLEILHLKVQKSYEKAKLKTKLKVKKVLYCDSHKTTGSIRIKLWKLFKECQFFPQENGCFAQNNYFFVERICDGS